MFKKLICAVFGHSPPCYAKQGWYSPGEQYGHAVSDQLDGINRQHYKLYAECARCEEKFMVARFSIKNPKSDHQDTIQ